jgi:signal transduction histidine kinase/ActR/RegA family two-component response regulator
MLSVGLTLVALGSWLTHNAMRGYLQEQIEKRATAATNALKQAGDTIVDRAEVEEFVASLRSDADLKQIVVVGRESKVIASSNREQVGTPYTELDDKWLVEQIRGAIEHQRTARHSDDERSEVILVSPVRRPPKPDDPNPAPGAVAVRFDTSGISADLARSSWILTSFLIGSIVLLLLVGYLLQRLLVLRPLANMIETMDRRTAGDARAFARQGSSDEIGMVAGALNRLLAAQEQARQELAERNEALSAASRAAQAANRAKSDFLANMSHEIRTPMTSILGFAELLADESIPPADRTTYLDVVRRNGRHLLSVINDILDLSRIEASRLPLHLEETSLQAVVDDALELLRHLAVDKKLSLRRRFHGLLPRTIYTDALRVRQILTNLLGNAIKFTDQGEIVVDVAMSGEWLRIDVSDTGIGLRSGEIDRLFRPFEQGDGSTARRFGGVGLGLSIARSLADALGGKLTFIPRDGGGSVFRLELSCGSLADREMVHLPEELVRPGGEASRMPPPRSLEGLRILLAEDGVDNQKLITHHLRRAGAHVDVANDGREAVHRVTERCKNPAESYHLILMDMQMPGMDGYEATRALRELELSVPIIALTAHAMAGDRETCLAAGCNAYATKPLEPAELVNLVALHASGEARQARV